MILALGITLLTACRPPTLKDPQPSCVISLRLGTFNCGPRNLDYQLEREKVGEWADLSYNLYGSISQLQDKSLLNEHTSILNDLELKLDSDYDGDIKNAPSEFQKLYSIEKFRVSLLTQSLELVSFTTESYLLKIKPRMKEGHDYFMDKNSK